MSDNIIWHVLADGDVVGRFDNFEDADNMASAWNAAYPHEPWFYIEALVGPEQIAAGR